MPANITKRPNYYEGQYLGAEDLLADQEYQRQQDQRHRLASHTWGIAAGLELDERSQPGGGTTVDIYIKPGYAVDGFGRALVVLEPCRIDPALFQQFPAIPNVDEQHIPVWLRYREEKSDPPRPGFQRCCAEEQLYRIDETFRIVVGDVLPAQQHSPIEIGGDTAFPALDESVPHQELPTSEDARWLIRLGSVSWSGTELVKSTNPDTLLTGRRFIGLVGDQVLAPDHGLRIADRFATTPLPTNVNDPLYGGVAVTVEGSLTVERALTARQDLYVEGSVGIGTKSPARQLVIQGNDPVISLLDSNNPGRYWELQARAFKPETFGIVRYEAGSAKDAKSLVVSGAGNVGIGTASPTLKLEIEGEQFGRDNGAATLHLWGSRVGDVGNGILFLRGKGTVAFDGAGDRVGIGTAAPGFILDVADRMRVRQGASLSAGIWFFQNTPGADKGFVGMAADDQIGFWGDVANWSLVMNTGTGNVGIGTQTPASKLEVAGDITATGVVHATNILWISDAKLKTDVKSLPAMLGKLHKVRGVSYQPVGTSKASTSAREIGLIAQEIETVFPELVKTFGPAQTRAVDYGKLSVVLLEAVKELMDQNAALSKRLDVLEQKRSKAPKKAKE